MGVSSRPPRTGSIAAGPASWGPESGSGASSRPPRTGSIAASASPAGGSRRWRGRPVRQGRAPLRPAGQLRVAVRQRQVVPSAKDGLHCGYAADAFVQAAEVRRPVRQGRAPLRQYGAGYQSPPVLCRPVRQGRAPLRQELGFEVGAGVESSRPPRTGSIAAVGRDADRRVSGAVVPSAKDGLHCGQPTNLLSS